MIARLNDFKGIWQANGDSGISGAYAYDTCNVSTERGALASAAGFGSFLPPLASSIGTLARLYRRDAAEDQREVFAACALDGLYTYTAGDAGWTCRFAGPLYSDAWGWVAYEENGVDLLILTNAKDGMIALYGDDLRVERKTTPAKFAVLGRHAERIWGAGVEGEPDSLYYSRPYNPFDWTADETNPELGGGQILQPTWDGDRFIALRELGAYLIALKTNSVYQVRGTDPSSFVITQEYGADAPDAEATIAVDGTRMYYLTGREIGVYDGVSAQLLAQNALYETLRDLRSTGAACAAVCGHVYYLALPIGSVVNNTVIEYDTVRRTFMVRTGIYVRSFLESEGKLYFTSSQDPYRVYQYGIGTGYDGQAIACRWQTGWQDGNAKRMRKEAFILRFYAEGDAVLHLTLETECKRKTRSVSLQPEGKSYRVRMPVRGVRWRLTIESEGTQPWSIRGGIEVSAEEEELE